jgi:hypothetical protein
MWLSRGCNMPRKHTAENHALADQEAKERAEQEAQWQANQERRHAQIAQEIAEANKPWTPTLEQVDCAASLGIRFQQRFKDGGDARPDEIYWMAWVGHNPGVGVCVESWEDVRRFAIGHAIISPLSYLESADAELTRILPADSPANLQIAALTLRTLAGLRDDIASLRQAVALGVHLA